MKPDGTDSFSTTNEDARLSEGTQVTGSTDTVGAEVRSCSSSAPATWSYLFVHHSRVAKFEEWLRKDGKTFFVHKTIRYYRKNDKLKCNAERCLLLADSSLSKAALKKHKPTSTGISQVIISARTVVPDEWHRFLIPRCDHSCASAKPHPNASASSFIHSIIMLATASCSVSPLATWLI